MLTLYLFANSVNIIPKHFLHATGAIIDVEYGLLILMGACVRAEGRFGCRANGKMQLTDAQWARITTMRATRCAPWLSKSDLS